MDANSVISIGILYSSLKNYPSFDFDGLHLYVSSRFNYYEIIVIANPSDFSPDDEAALLNSPNTRLVVLNNTAPDDILRKKLFELAIGDYIVLYDPCETQKEILELVINSNISGYDFTGVVYGKNRLSLYSVLSRLFFFIVSKLSGFRLDGNLSYTGCYSRALIEAINTTELGQNYLRLLLAAAGFKSLKIEGASRSARSLSQIFSRLGGILDIIGSAPHRLLQLTSWLSLGACVGNFVYIAYVVVIWLFASHIQPGWTTTSLTQSFFLGILFFTVFVFSCVFSTQLSKKAQTRFSIARDVSRSECISSSSTLNVTDNQ